MSDYIYPLRLFLNTALPQSPTNISKTQKSIEFIKNFSLIGRFQGAVPEHGVHHLSIVLTNNSLSEGSQWSVRLNKKLQRLNTWFLSSKKDSSAQNLNQFWGKLASIDSPNDLVDLLVMLINEVRMSDLIQIIKKLKQNRYNFKDIGIHHITLSIMFDEADKNIKLISEFIKEIQPLLRDSVEGKDDVIRDIHFITATPLKDFWKKLKHCGIEKLENINHALTDMDESSLLHLDYKELMKDYRKLNDHKINHDVESMTDDPVEYASLVLAKWGNHNPSHPRVVFAPAEMARKTHYAMRDLFLTRGYWAYVDNGEKGKGKGFYNPRGQFQSLEDFRKQHNIKGEPYETFVKWKELHPTESLVITGWLTVIRGVTFNTTNFNFTNQITSACHLENIADLIQVAGRGNGDKQYVGIFEHHCPKGVWDKLIEQVNLIMELLEKNPSEFVERDFRPQTKREMMDVAMTVPYVIPINEEEFNSIQKVGRSYNVVRMLRVIQNHNEELANRLAGMEKKQISQPEEGPSIKKHITDFIQAFENNTKYSIDISKKDMEKKEDLYQIFIDKTAGSRKLIVSIFLGSQLGDFNEED